ncbi:DUF1302 domain-containing protein [Marinobacterium arenosum]|uniref:DUF1302 domain-containing protein n=1 Tax=Marinobacterium arenosum TaxID=2862496 RepID=UPI001C94820C|nr:DUF1302 domain-containing protein [Marinobacterium arenosum]MBY4677481.1 DUF1302 domain-containing protein [Marinobacterium arenosum]
MATKKRAEYSGRPQARGPRRLLPLAIAATIASSSAQAVEFNLGDIEGRFDSQLSVGVSWRAEERDPSLVAVPNGGTSKGSGSYDDGNLNFDDGDTFSQIFKGVHDLELRYDNVGAFVRGKYWYDFELEDGSRPHGHANNGYVPGAGLNDDGFNDFAEFSGVEILDAYVYGEFDLGDKPLDLRLGRQVVNWGESTFIQGGINSINPFDVNAFRRPGAEIKEGLLPSNMAFASLGLTDNLSVEGFYQLEWEPTAIDGCGTYFSTSDFTAEGCNGIRISSANLPGSSTSGDQIYFNALSGVLGFDPVVRRNADGRREADDDNQFGLAFRYFAEQLNNTEFGFYFAKYHSRLPLISGVKTPIDPTLLVAAGVDPSVAPTVAAFSSTYFIEYPEDIELYGLSWSTNIGDVAWSGEYSYKKDQPIQMNGPMLVGSMLTLGTQPGNPANGTVVPIGTAGLGADIQGYTAFDVSQLQTTFIKFIDQVWGASRMTLIGELGWTHIHDFDESENAIKYGRNGVFGFTPGDQDGFVTQNSWGYVLRGKLEYPSAFAGVNLTPEVSFKHGVDGYGPQPGAAFNEDQKSLSLSLTGDYLNQYRVQLAYTSFFGGDFNEIEDRDFVSLSASVSF